MQRERDISRVILVSALAESIRFHPGSHRNVRLIDKFQLAQQRVKSRQQIRFRQTARSFQSLFVFKVVRKKSSFAM